MLSRIQRDVLEIVVRRPGVRVHSLPCYSGTVRALVRMGLCVRSNLGPRKTKASFSAFVYPTAAALLATGRVAEYARREAL